MTDSTIPAPGRLQGWSDRLNPILVRDVQQSLRGRSFIVVLALALVAMLVAAFGTTASGISPSELGRELMRIALMIFAPIAVLLIPIQAHTSMAREVRGDTGEQLMLTRLTPWGIVRGKITASMVQFAVFASAFGPLLAMTFLLRGVDVLTIVFFLALGALVCLCATAVCIASGALSRIQFLAGLLFSGIAMGLAMLTVGSMTAMQFLPRQVPSLLAQEEFWIGACMVLTGTALGLTLVSMVAASMLTHPNENRSSQFRVFLVLAPLVGWAWVLANPFGFGGDWWRNAPLGCATFSSVLCGAGWLFALTEDERLSPRVRAYVPASPLRALVTAPFLPGSGRGVAFFLINLVTIFGPMYSIYLWKGMNLNANRAWVPVAVAAYAFLYAFIGRQIRRMGIAGSQGNWSARGLTFAAILVSMLIPQLLAALMDLGRGWSMMRITQPPFAIRMVARGTDIQAILTVLLVGVGIALALSLRPMIRGQLEVMAASRDRRRYHAGGDSTVHETGGVLPDAT